MLFALVDETVVVLASAAEMVADYAADLAIVVDVL